MNLMGAQIGAVSLCIIAVEVIEYRFINVLAIVGDAQQHAAFAGDTQVIATVFGKPIAV